jgi:YD repeat-containing protein
MKALILEKGRPMAALFAGDGLDQPKKRDFWHPPVWKWALCAVLTVVAVAIFFWPAHPVKVEVVPFSDTPPAWDGSQAWLIITPITQTNPIKFKSQIAMVKPTVRHDAPVNEFVVNLRNGNFKLLQTDLFVPDVVPLCLTRSYWAWNTHSHAFGVGTNHPYDICPTGTRFPYTYMDLNLEDGYKVNMPRVSKGTGYADAVFRHTQSSSEFFGAEIAWNGNGWTMTFRDQRKIYFPEAYYAKNFAQGAATEMMDAEGHRVELKRNSARNLEELISPNGHRITFHYDSHDRIVQAQDDAGHIRKYAYDSTGHLESVSDASQVLYRFEYTYLPPGPDTDPYLLTAVLDGSWGVLVKNRYANGRVSQQNLADGTVYRYDYRFNQAGVVDTTVTMPSGQQRMFLFRDGILTGQK